MYIVKRYDEASIEPESPRTFATLASAQQCASCDGEYEPDDTLAGDRYDDGSIHVEAYYFNEHQSSGYWILEVED